MPKPPEASSEDDIDDGEDTFGEEATTILRLTVKGPRKDGRDRHLLVCTEGASLGQVLRLGNEDCRIGRHASCELRLDDQGVSRRHARIRPAGKFYVLEDLDSANGTFVQGDEISERLLDDGDVIEFGPSASFRYTVADRNHERMLRELHQATLTDRLTGIGNRRFFDTQLAAEISYASRHETNVGLMMLDIDHFKRVNDTYGHPAGDAVIRAVAQTIKGTLRTEDILARYGGEEFAVLIRGASQRTTEVAAERVRFAVEQTVVQAAGADIAVTVSIGCSTLADGGRERLIGLADSRLYAAKHQGRNRVVAEG